MADVELEYNGNFYPIVEADLLLKRVGNWTAYLNSIDSDSVPIGQCQLHWQGTTFQAYVLRSGITEGRVSAILVGGFGALDEIVSPQMFDYQFALSMPVSKTITEIGLKLNPSMSYIQLISKDITSDLLSSTMNSWPRKNASLADTLDDLCDTFNRQNKRSIIWRIQPDGTIFLGDDTWEEANDFPHEIIRRAPSLNSLVIGAESIGLYPGQTYVGPEEQSFKGQIGAIHYIIRSSSSRAKVYFQDSKETENSLKQGMIRIIRETMRDVEWHKSYAGSVIQQRNDTTLDVHLDNPDLPILTSVRLRVPVPGSKIVVNPKDRVNVIFSEGNNAQPEALLWEGGSNNKAVHRVGDKGVGGSISVVVLGFGAPPGTYTIGFNYTDPDGNLTQLGKLIFTGSWVPDPVSLGIANIGTKATTGSEIFFIP